MGNRNYRKPNDGRSNRKSRLSPVERILMRAFPRMPATGLATPDVCAPALAQLAASLTVFTREAEDELDSRVSFTMLTHCYPLLLAEIFGERSDTLLCHGTYLFVEASTPNRVLYVGSASETFARHRCVNHLSWDGNKAGMLARIRMLLGEWAHGVDAPTSEEAGEEAIRRAAFGMNRWALSGSGNAQRARSQAIEAISRGGFDVAVFAIGSEQRVLARLLERFLHQRCQRDAGVLPPLNDEIADLGEGYLRKRPRGELAPERVLALRARLDAIA